MNITSLLMTLQIIALVVLFIDLVFVVSQKPSGIKTILCILLIATIMMFVGYIIEIQSKSLEGAEIGAAVSYIGKPFIMLYSYFFINEFYGYKINKYIFFFLNLISCGYFILVYTNPIHHLYYATTAFEVSNKFSPLVVTKGKLYFTYILAAVLFFLNCIFSIVRGYHKNKTKENLKISLYMSFMVIFGLLGYVTYLCNMIDGYDSTMMGILCSSFCLSVMFFKYKIFDVLSFAKNEALKDSTVGLIVLDQSDNVLYTNVVGTKLFKELGIYYLNSMPEEGGNAFYDNHVYFVHTKKINMNNVYYGKSIEINDVTTSYNYQTRLEYDVAQRTERIENIQRQVIGSFASIVESRSLETGEHIARTCEYVEMIAKELQKRGLYTDLLTDSYISLLKTASMLHDIGKIAVPDGILNKPGKLTSEEREQMKLHSEEGAKIIENTMRGVENDEYVDLAIEIALYHHEWYDGSGYPRGLSAQNIPLSARIMAIADTYDALINKRCYKEAYSSQISISLIKEETGNHFDPELVDAFLATLNK